MTHMGENMKIKDAVDYFKAKGEVSVLYVFGIRKGLLNPDRELGIGLLVDEENCGGGCQDMLAMGSWDLSDDFPQWPVSVVLLNSAPAFVRYHVVRKGSVVLERTPSCRLRFSEQAVSDYLDQKPAGLYNPGEIEDLGLELFEVLEEHGL